jgi:hypothetical protein
VGSAALYFVVKNYQMAVTSNRPELASNGFHIQLASRRPLVAVDLLNSARRQPVGATPPYMPWPNYELDGSLRKIGDAPIVGAGTNVFAGYGSSARFDSTSIDASAFFLVCVSYFEDAGVRYSQAMMFERSPKTARDPAELAYAELASPISTAVKRNPEVNRAARESRLQVCYAERKQDRLCQKLRVRPRISPDTSPKPSPAAIQMQQGAPLALSFAKRDWRLSPKKRDCAENLFTDQPAASSVLLSGPS